MAEQSASESSPDRDFDITADMLVNDFDDERTMEEEEAMESNEDVQNELDDLHKEGDMPIEELLSMYGYGDGAQGDQTAQSSSSEEILGGQDMTLGKDDIALLPREEEDEDEEEEEEEEETGCGSPDVAGKQQPEEELSGADMMMDDAADDPSVSTSRLLRSAVSHHQSDSESESDQEDYVPEDDDDYKRSRLALARGGVAQTIQVGSDYQAQIPDGLCRYDGAPAYENDDKLLWDPSKIMDLDVEDYLRRCQQPLTSCTQSVHAIPSGGHVRDDEQALYLLLQCGHNFEEAMRRRRMQAVPPADTMSLWSEEECRSFESGLRTHGKDFHQVQQNKVRTRSVGELVQFYYLWKKTERHDVFANKTRLEKKKYSLHPGTTDYMDRFLDEQENPTAHRDRSSSPNVHSLLSGDHKRQQQQQHLHQHSNVRSPASAATDEQTTARNNNNHHPHHHHLQPRILLDQLPLKSPSDTNGNAAASTDQSTRAAQMQSSGHDTLLPPMRKQSPRDGDANNVINNNNVSSETNHHHNHLHRTNFELGLASGNSQSRTLATDTANKSAVP